MSDRFWFLERWHFFFLKRTASGEYFIVISCLERFLFFYFLFGSGKGFQIPLYLITRLHIQLGSLVFLGVHLSCTLKNLASAVLNADSFTFWSFCLVSLSAWHSCIGWSLWTTHNWKIQMLFWVHNFYQMFVEMDSFGGSSSYIYFGGSSMLYSVWFWALLEF